MSAANPTPKGKPAPDTGAEALMHYFHSRCTSARQLQDMVAEIALHSLCELKDSPETALPNIITHYSQDLLALWDWLGRVESAEES